MCLRKGAHYGCGRSAANWCRRTVEFACCFRFGGLSCPGISGIRWTFASGSGGLKRPARTSRLNALWWPSMSKMCRRPELCRTWQRLRPGEPAAARRRALKHFRSALFAALAAAILAMPRGLGSETDCSWKQVKLPLFFVFHAAGFFQDKMNYGRLHRLHT